MTVYRGDGFSYRGTVKTLSGASDSPDITFSLVSEPDMRPRLRFPTFLALSGPPKNSPTKSCGTSERCVSPYAFPIFVILGVTDRSNRDRKKMTKDRNPKLTKIFTKMKNNFRGSRRARSARRRPGCRFQLRRAKRAGAETGIRAACPQRAPINKLNR